MTVAPQAIDRLDIPRARIVGAVFGNETAGPTPDHLSSLLTDSAQ
jgi:hypothetical protein